MLKRAPAFSFAALFVVACASQPPPQANSAANSAPSSAPNSAATTDSTAGADSKAADGDGKGWADSQHDSFMKGCMAKVNASDYCSCGFDQFRDAFKDGPPTDGPSPDPRLKALAERTKSECASKLPEDIVKASFLSSCVQDDKRKAAYCECAWPALRKNLAVSDFVGDPEGPRMDTAKKSMVAACKGKFPADVAKADFLKACTKDDPGKAKPCECVWKKLRAKFSTEEIVSGLADLSSAEVAACK
jgi:hypothetical protein